MPDSTHGTVLLMGSGEMSASMVEVHKHAMTLIDGPARAVFVDTPAGFQLNADLISQKAVEYFDKNVQASLKIVSFKNAWMASAGEIREAVKALSEANYIFAGPGSPTYALDNWRHTPPGDAIGAALLLGGCLAFASAASLTLGRFTIPVYEVYKVGEAPRWVDGLNTLGRFGLDVAVVPHWNNTSGGDHDTRYCFMGEPRWQILEEALPDSTTVLGLDEHTACLLRLDVNAAEVYGVGHVTLRKHGHQQTFLPGQSFSLDLLRPDIESIDQTVSPAEQNGAEWLRTWETLKAEHHALLAAPAASRGDLIEHTYILLRSLQLMREQDAWDSMPEVENALREALVRVLSVLDRPTVNAEKVIKPYVELLLQLRAGLRANNQWALADQVRDGLLSLDIEVRDGQNGSEWVKIDRG